MKLNQERGSQKSGAITQFAKACAASCRKALARVARVKAAIFEESRRTLAVQDRLVQLALNEAEALAVQAGYPHLLFPTLALEKVQTVAKWSARQRAVTQRKTEFAFAA